MLLFYHMGHILHFPRYFTSFRKGSCLISLYPIFSPLFLRTFALLLLPFPLFKPRFLNFVRCSRVFAISLFPNTRKRCIPIICCNRQLEYSQPGSSTGALQKLYASSTTAPVIQLLNKPVANPLLPYLPPEGNTITVVLHSTTLVCIPIAYSLLNNCPERPVAYTLYKPPVHCFYPPAFPHIAYNAPYSPQNAPYWLFVFSWYNFPSICQKRLQLNSAVRAKMVLRQQAHLSIPTLSQGRIQL